MRRTISTALAVLCLSLVPTFAHADDAAVAEAKARFGEGVALADAGKHEEARLKFQQAAAVLKAAAVMYNLARSEQLTGHDFEAIEHYRTFLRLGANDPTIKDEQRKAAQGYIAELTPKVGQVDIDAPASSRISIDGKTLEEHPKEPVAVQPGHHTIEAVFEGKAKSVPVECTAGKIVKAKIEFESSTIEPPPPGGGGGAWPTGKIVTVAGLGVGAIVGGVVFGVFRSKAQSKVDEAKSLLNGQSCVDVPPPNSTCDRASSLKSDRDSNVTISTVGLVAGVVLAAGAVGAIVLWPSNKESAVITPAVGPGVAGASLSGRF